MRRFLRLLTLWLFALALPAQGVLAATAMGAGAAVPATAHAAMAMPDGTAVGAAHRPAPAADAPSCHGHAVDKAGCGACCGPVAAQRELLAVAPAAVRATPLPRAVAQAAAPAFLTGGTDRPPRPRLD